MRRIRAGRVVCAIEVDEMAAFLEWLDVEIAAELVRLAPARLISKEDLHRVRRHTGLEQPRRRHSAIAPVYREREPADAFGGATLCACRPEGDLLRVSFEGQDEAVPRIVRIPLWRERGASRVGIEDDDSRSVLVGEPDAISAKTHDARTALESVDAEPLLGRRDGERRSGVGQIDIAAAADLEDLTDGHLVTRDRREERLWTGEPFAVAFAALLRFARVLVGRGHLVRAGSFAARASAWMVPSSPRPKSRVSGRSIPMGVLAAKR